jgi:hypothetical protein
LHEALLALKDMMAADLAAIFDDARAVTTGSTVTKREVRMLGLPLIDSVGGAVVDAEATHTARGGKKASALVAQNARSFTPIPLDEARAVVKTTPNGPVTYGTMSKSELESTLEKIEAAIANLPAGVTIEMLTNRRNAAMTLLAE